MGTDTPAAVLSQRARLLYDYFVELFAQVTNPPLDAIREAVVTSMARVMGPEQNLLEPSAASCRQIKLAWPVLDNDELNKIVHINDDGEQPGLRTAVLRALYDVERGGEGLADAIEDLRIRACEAIAKGARTLVISDRDSDHTRAPIPSLLAVSAVHHHLVRTKERTTVALVVESGDAREVHHIAMLIGFGAAAVNPYLAFESIEDLVREGELTGIEAAAAVRNYLKALGKGVMKVMSKMGISTVASYTAAQAFEAIGLDRDVVDEYFAGTPSQLGGVGLDVIAEEVKQRHRRAYPENPTERVHRRLDVGGEYAFRREGELHLFTPEVVFLLQHSTRTGRYDVFQQYSEEVDRLSREGGTLRGLFELEDGTTPAGPARRGRVRRLDRHPVQHRRNELRLHLGRGARNHGDRDEQPRRAVQLRRGRRRRRPALRPAQAQRRQTGGVRPIRGHQRLSGERVGHSDQDGAGRQAG